MKKKLILPKKIKVGGALYKVLKSENHTQDENAGYHDCYKSIIMVATKDHGVTKPNARMLEVLLHEVLHAVDFVYCNDMFSETVIDTLSRSLFDFFVNNNLMLSEKRLPKKIRIRGFVYNVVYPACGEFDMDIKALYSTTNHNTLKLYVREFSDEGVYYIKSKLLGSVLSMIMTTENAISEEDHEAIIDSGFKSGLYQVLVDNKLDDLIRNSCER